MDFSASQLRWFRLRRSGLVTPFPSPEAAASALVGIQAQILPAAGLALWNRTQGLTYPDLDDRLHERRTLVKLWGQRGTLHLYPSAEWPLLHGALSGHQTWWQRQNAKAREPEAYEQAVAQVAALLRARGTLTRSDLRAADLGLHDDHFSSWGGIFAELMHRGLACHAGQEGNEGRFAHREVWLPDLTWEPPGYHEANEVLVRRYFTAYGPSTVKDFIYWRVAPAAEARRWVAAQSDALVEITVEGQPYLALRTDLEALQEPPPEREAWPVRLLYRFDPLLLAHKEKAWLVEAACYNRVWRPAGHVEGTVLAEGRIAGTWRYDRAGKGLTVTVAPFAPLPAPVQAAVEREAAGIAAFFELPLTALTVLASGAGL